MSDQLYAVDARIEMPGASVEIRSYQYPTPFAGTAERSQHTLSMALTPNVPYSQLAPLDADGNPGTWGDAGDVIFLPAGVATLCRGAGGEERRLCCSFSADMYALPKDAPWSEADWSAGCNVQMPSVKRDLYRLANEAMHTTPATADYAAALVTVLWIEIQRNLEQARQLRRSFNGRLAAWQLRRITDYVEGQIEPVATVDELARLCSLSARHLGRAFKASTGQTLGDYIKSARLLKAKSLLRDTGFSQKEIAHRLGFATVSSFSVAFSKATGMTPKQFRQLEQADNSASRDLCSRNEV
jgi:AraC family transcriptional regulator